MPPAGMFSDGATAMAELRSCMRTLGFKSKHVTSIFSLSIAVLELGNSHFTEGASREDTAHVAYLMELEHAATLLGEDESEEGGGDWSGTILPFTLSSTISPTDVHSSYITEENALNNTR
jgi:hypothetical protein